MRALIALSAESLTEGVDPDAQKVCGRPNLANLIDYSDNSSTNIWIHDSYMMNETIRMDLINEWLAANGSRPLEQVIESKWNGSDAQGPFLKQGEKVFWNLTPVPGEDLEVVLSFNQRPFGAVSDDLNLAVVLPSGQRLWMGGTWGESLEGTERVIVPAYKLDGVDKVTIEIDAGLVGVGNYSGVLGSDGDMLGFALAVKGVSGEVADFDDDGVVDSQDICVGFDDTIDSDMDGFPDGCDEFPENGQEWIDSDGDGIGDNNDVFPQDSNESKDTDYDGVGDNSDFDADGDGLSNNEENELGTDSSYWDTDRDGISDYLEVTSPDATNPLSKDTDRDGIWDGADQCPTENKGDGGGAVDPQTGLETGCPAVLTLLDKIVPSLETMVTVIYFCAILCVILGFVLVWRRWQKYASKGASFSEFVFGRQKKKGEGGVNSSRVVFGLVLCIGGFIATQISYDSARVGETYSIYYGAVLWGLWEILAGLSGSDKKRSNEESVDEVEEIDDSETGESE